MTELVPERGPAAMSLAAAGAIGFGPSGFDLSPNTLAEVVAFSKLMCTAGHAIPKHLRDNPGACMAVTLDAMHLRMSPFSLARKSHLINDNLGYEAQVVAAAINTAPITRKRPSISFTGEGQTRQCTVILHLIDGDTDPVTSPQIQNIKTQNSPLWKSDPDQQLSYYTIRAAGRRHCPEVMLGMMDRDELDGAEPIAGQVTGEGTGMGARLAAREVSVDAPGFNARAIADQLGPETTEPPKPKRGRPKKEAANEMLDAIAEVEPELVAQVIEDHGDDLDEVLDGDQVPTDGAASIETDNAPSVEHEPITSASAESAVLALAAETFGAIASDEPSQSGEPKEVDDKLPEGKSFAVLKRNAGPAPADTVYILSRAVPGYDGKVATFKDGKPFSTVGAKGALLLMTFDEHPQAPEKAAEPAREVEAADVAKEDASPFEPFWQALQGAIHWADAKDVIRALYRMPEFTALALADKAELRAQVWLEIDASDNINVDMADDPTAFRLWLDTQEGRDGADAIDGNFRVLKAGAPFKAMNADNQDALEDVVQATTARLRL